MFGRVNLRFLYLVTFMENNTAVSYPAAKEISLFEKPRLKFWQIWNMSFGFLGIQFGFGLQNANVNDYLKIHSVQMVRMIFPFYGFF